MLAHIKSLLRRNTSDFDNEIQGLIDQAKADLVLGGIRAETIDESDPLIKKAIEAYCKANFGFGQEDYERLMNSYKEMKSQLMTSVEYGSEYVE